ncbi:LytR/AlgR family response regulator transcription factor [Flagellimonas nanhaiensis]|uniref:DNA-binding response regulator n=1 Tax=Flagellimonas nanhaiensis TaxID=2292706 RepID=A0A371JQH9_9FLAO|nr:response regulator transcription factor [Allomuricauda nanhaiensis]RDY59760.1 DNA-binding response regulator [Allomuricauda nanhaiensis]
MQLRCIIIDDEYLARQRIIKLLEKHRNILVVAECRNGKEAIERIQLKEPDFVFLDIQMPDFDGFAVLQKLQKIPYVIFTTAYDSFALKAFEINAVDYLLKPFDQERLDASIDRMQEIKKTNKAYELGEKLSGLFKEIKQIKDVDHRTDFTIKKNGRLLRISTEDVIFLKSEGNYLELHTDSAKHLYRATISAMEKELSAGEFLRVHRSLILSKRYIQSCRYMGNSYYKIRLKTGLEFTSGRSYKANIVSYLEENNS